MFCEKTYFRIDKEKIITSLPMVVFWVLIIIKIWLWKLRYNCNINGLFIRSQEFHYLFSLEESIISVKKEDFKTIFLPPFYFFSYCEFFWSVSLFLDIFFDWVEVRSHRLIHHDILQGIYKLYKLHNSNLTC